MPLSEISSLSLREAAEWYRAVRHFDPQTQMS